MLDQALSLVKAGVQHAIAGFPETDDTTYYKRLAICERCPLKQPGWVCGSCECRLLTKARWAEQDCPVCVNCGENIGQHAEGGRGCGEFVSKWDGRKTTVVSPKVSGPCCR